MTQYLPPNLLALFAPREPIPFLPPLDKLPHEKKLTPYNGVAQFLQEFEVNILYYSLIIYMFSLQAKCKFFTSFYINISLKVFGIE